MTAQDRFKRIKEKEACVIALMPLSLQERIMTARKRLADVVRREAEAVRDRVLASSGHLDTTMFGAPVGVDADELFKAKNTLISADTAKALSVEHIGALDRKASIAVINAAIMSLIGSQEIKCAYHISMYNIYV
jgi:hypothetical protein